ncbi:hypothetical protein HMPREF9997_00798 [Corynebacterium durum F0235]|uniref:Uncharacterized protein n=1 Tax=Corynebacterium durum F0235 TaxID=1035195 RepID=L1MJU0_9CORY|nr:hypothetical protein HMPREF9997_00798 [Corynebacterium durum F0235]
MKHKATIYLNRKMNKELSWTHRKTIKKKVQHCSCSSLRTESRL